MSTHPGCNQFKHAPGCGHPGATGGPAEAAGIGLTALDVVVAARDRADEEFAEGDAVIWTDPDGGQEYTGTLVDADPDADVLSMITSDGGDFEVMRHELRRARAEEPRRVVDDPGGFWDDANPLYPNGRCDACGFGLDEGRACYNSDCSDFDADSPYAYHDVATTAYDDPADPGLWQSQAAADMADLADGEKHLFVSADGATRVLVTCERAQAFNEFGYAVPGATRGAYRVRPVDAPAGSSVEFPFDNMNGNESQGTWSAAGLVREMLKPTE